MQINVFRRSFLFAMALFIAVSISTTLTPAPAQSKDGIHVSCLAIADMLPLWGSKHC